MTDRERVLRIMHYQPVDRHPMHLVGPWGDTLERWYGEGLPRDVDLNEYLGLTPIQTANVSPNTGIHPAFEQCTVSEDDTFLVTIDRYGRTVRNFKNHTSMPEWIEFPVKTPGDLRRVLDEHFQVDDLDARFPDDWEANVHQAVADHKLIVADGGCYYWTLRSLAGVECASYLFYDAPDLVDELFERYNTVVLEGIRRAAKLARIDLIGYGEDIAYKTGPLISPDMFRRFVLPRYKKAMDLAHANGVELTWYDSDGDIRQFIPDYLSVGINGLAPCEVAAGMVPSELRKQYGRDLRLVGGIDKREIAKGPVAIDAEMARNKPVIDDGGFLPAIDHSIPADVSFDNYRYFIDALRNALELTP